MAGTPGAFSLFDTAPVAFRWEGIDYPAPIATGDGHYPSQTRCPACTNSRVGCHPLTQLSQAVMLIIPVAATSMQATIGLLPSWHRPNIGDCCEKPTRHLAWTDPNTNRVPNDGSMLRPHSWPCGCQRPAHEVSFAFRILIRTYGSVDLVLGSNQRTGKARELEPRHVPGMHECGGVHGRMECCM